MGILFKAAFLVTSYLIWHTDGRDSNWPLIDKLMGRAEINNPLAAATLAKDYCDLYGILDPDDLKHCQIHVAPFITSIYTKGNKEDFTKFIPNCTRMYKPKTSFIMCTQLASHMSTFGWDLPTIASAIGDLQDSWMLLNGNMFNMGSAPAKTSKVEKPKQIATCLHGLMELDDSAFDGKVLPDANQSEGEQKEIKDYCGCDTKMALNEMGIAVARLVAEEKANDLSSQLVELCSSTKELSSWSYTELKLVTRIINSSNKTITYERLVKILKVGSKSLVKPFFALDLNWTLRDYLTCSLMEEKLMLTLSKMNFTESQVGLFTTTVVEFIRNTIKNMNGDLGDVRCQLKKWFIPVNVFNNLGALLVDIKELSNEDKEKFFTDNTLEEFLNAYYLVDMKRTTLTMLKSIAQKRKMPYSTLYKCIIYMGKVDKVYKKEGAVNDWVPDSLQSLDFKITFFMKIEDAEKYCTMEGDDKIKQLVRAVLQLNESGVFDKGRDIKGNLPELP